MAYVHECGVFCRDDTHQFGFLVPLVGGDEPPEASATEARLRFKARRLADGEPVEILMATAHDHPPVGGYPAVREIAIVYRQLPPAAAPLRS